MDLTRWEQETVINFNNEEDYATVFTCNKSLRNRLAKFAEKSDDCCLIKHTDNDDTYRIPKSWVKINMPRQYSDEQRQKMAERARANLQKQNN